MSKVSTTLQIGKDKITCIYNLSSSIAKTSCGNPKGPNTDKKLLDLQFDGLAHLVPHKCKNLKTEVLECSEDTKYTSVRLK